MSIFGIIIIIKELKIKIFILLNLFSSILNLWNYKIICVELK